MTPRKLFLALTLCGLAAAAPRFALADEAVRSAQESLQALGFYTGPVNGENSDDLRGAIRRFQKRNGLEATGELNAETATALNQGGEAGQGAESGGGNPQPPAIPKPTPSRAPAPAPQPPSAPPVRPVTPRVPSAARAPGVPSAATDPRCSDLFYRTPYENAPASVQHDTIRKAQALLARQGLFDGVIDGQPGPATEEGIFRYQSQSRMRRTGILDLSTLAQMRLLPDSQAPTRSAPRIYEGRIPHPAEPVVRGVPLD
jgi:peptidoglycan hydrolase-like protein with peptidoglycan-binding domain